MNEERKPISLQDIFNAAWQAFIVEDKPPAISLGGGCLYDDGKGNKCAVGLCLPEGHDALRVEVPFSDLVEIYPALFDAQIRDMPQWELDDFQRVLHDGLINRKGSASGCWANDKLVRTPVYRVVAKAYNLTIPE
jgi:hypothetical protein